MTRAPAPPPVTLSQEDIVSFWRDGVICVRQLYSAEWRARLAEALEEASSGRSPGVMGLIKQGRDYSEAWAWLWNDTIRDFVFDAPSAGIAQQLFGSKAVNFYYDQIFIKDRGSVNPTPWHHDFTFWELQGDQILSLWTSLDAVDAESSSLEFIAGSHRWPQRFRAIGLNGADFSGDRDLLKLPDFDNERDKYPIKSWAVEPGDALVFHALTVHGAQGNKSGNSARRAITTRWCGDDVIFKPRGLPLPYHHGLEHGDKLGGLIYPRVWPTIDEEAVKARLEGPLLPDLKLLEQQTGKLAKAIAAAQAADETQTPELIK